MCDNHAFFVNTFQLRGEIKKMFYRIPEVTIFKMAARLWKRCILREFGLLKAAVPRQPS